MGVFNRFVSAIRVNDEEYDEDELYEDEDEALDFEEEKPKKGFFSRFLKRDNDSDNDDDDYEDDDDYGYSGRASKGRSAYSSGTRRNAPSSSRITPMQKKADKSRQLLVVKPTNMEETRDIADALLANGSVILNLEGLDVEVAQRVIDFSCGACYTLSGSLRQVSGYTFVLAPNGVSISGDVAADMLNGSVPTMRNNL